MSNNCHYSANTIWLTTQMAQVVIWAKPLFWVKAVSSSMGVIQNKIIQSFFSMGETCDKLVRLSQAFFIYTELKLLYRI